MIRHWWRTRVRRRDLKPGPPLTPEVEDRIWTEVQRRIALGEAGRPQLAPLPDRRPAILTIALLVCALLTTGILAAQRPGPEQEVAIAENPDSTLTLTDLARVARAQVPERFEEGMALTRVIDYIPTATQRADGVVGRREVQEMTGDGRGEVRSFSLPESPGTYRPSTVTYDEPNVLQVAGFNPVDLIDLPGDPAVLLDVLLEGASSEGSLNPVTFFDLLATPLIPGNTRAAVFHLLDDMGAEVGEATTDPRSRPGVTLVVPPRGDQPGMHAVIDPTTSTLLSVRRGNPKSGDHDPAIAVYRSATVGPAI